MLQLQGEGGDFPMTEGLISLSVLQVLPLRPVVISRRPPLAGPRASLVTVGVNGSILAGMCQMTFPQLVTPEGRSCCLLPTPHRSKGNDN